MRGPLLILAADHRECEIRHRINAACLDLARYYIDAPKGELAAADPGF